MPYLRVWIHYVWSTKNRQPFLNDKLLCQDDYFAVSASESGLDAVRRYILNQEEHHKKKSFADEYKNLISKYGTPIKESR